MRLLPARGYHGLPEALLSFSPLSRRYFSQLPPPAAFMEASARFPFFRCRQIDYYCRRRPLLSVA